VVVALGACIVLLLGGGVVGALTVEEDEGGGDGTTTLEIPSAEPPPQQPPPPPIDLGAIVVPGPSGFDQIPDSRLPVGGAADANRLASERADQDRSKAVFADTGLVNGFVRAWQKPSTGELVTVRLYQFATPDGARNYANAVVNAMNVPPAMTFQVPATEDTTGIDTQVAQGANRLVYVVGRKGRVVAAVAATVVPPPDGSFLPPLVRSQLSLLP
jgi:hypothetical protein